MTVAPLRSGTLKIVPVSVQVRGLTNDANRSWCCIELLEEYCEAALRRFVRDPQQSARPLADPQDDSNYYRALRPGILWNGRTGEPLPKDGGKRRQLAVKARQGESGSSD